MKISVSAKLNLNLSVFDASDGYHNLRTEVASVDIADIVSIVKRTDRLVFVNNIYNVKSQDNIAYTTARLFVDALDCCGCKIHITKHIPVMAGMGGSSADASATLVAMCRMYGIPINDNRVMSIARQVGSDVVYMMSGGDAVLTSKGDIVQHHPYIQRYFVVTLFDFRLSTAEVFRLWDSATIDERNSARQYSNNLQYIVEANYDYMRQYLSICSELGLIPTMTGSGSAYFVCADSFTKAEQLSYALQSRGLESIACKSLEHGLQILQY